MRDLRDSLPEYQARLAQQGVPGFFLDLEPHVKGGGQFGGFSAPMESESPYEASAECSTMSALTITCATSTTYSRAGRKLSHLLRTAKEKRADELLLRLTRRLDVLAFRRDV